jgi:oxaloacetate decarboxylase alpha subunit
MGHTHRIDESLLGPIASHFRRVAEQEGHPIGSVNEFSLFNYKHQLPGGMTGTLKAQLAQYGMTERLDEVLEEVVRCREDLGHPISATPFSQLMGIQAVLNVVTGERYSVVPDEVIVYVLGHLGQPPAPIDQDVLDHILSTARGEELSRWEPPQPTIKELKRDYGNEHMSDEELLLRYIAPEQDILEVKARGPVSRSYRLRNTSSLTELLDEALSAKRPKYLHISKEGFTVTLRRP